MWTLINDNYFLRKALFLPSWAWRSFRHPVADGDPASSSSTRWLFSEVANWTARRRACASEAAASCLLFWSTVSKFGFPEIYQDYRFLQRRIYWLWYLLVEIVPQRCVNWIFFDHLQTWFAQDIVLPVSFQSLYQNLLRKAFIHRHHQILE